MVNNSKAPSKMKGMQRELEEHYADVVGEEEDDESFTNLFAKWVKQRMKTGKRKLAEVE